jgi:hypothetical protein
MEGLSLLHIYELTIQNQHVLSTLHGSVLFGSKFCYLGYWPKNLATFLAYLSKFWWISENNFWQHWIYRANRKRINYRGFRDESVAKTT